MRLGFVTNQEPRRYIVRFGSTQRYNHNDIRRSTTLVLFRLPCPAGRNRSSESSGTGCIGTLGPLTILGGTVDSSLKGAT